MSRSVSRSDRPALSRSELPSGENPCFHCPAKCCRYFALPLDRPTEPADYDQMRWFLLHEGAVIFTEDDHWFLLVFAKCGNLGEDHRCTGYQTRPQICRDYANDKCEYDDGWVYDRYFELPEQIAEYAEAVSVG
ncbi:MAG: YkgJ family cysteine cluster protein [Planctomycetia bacterium]|nr:YkgJ family cysteine cluster protein [Planctomycetia bacterium]